MNSGTTIHPCLGLSTRADGGIVIVELAGELDIASAPALRERLHSVLQPGCGRLVIDMSRVSFCDASGLAVLVSTDRQARLIGGFVRLAAVSPQVGHVLNISGLRLHLAIFPTVAAAAAGAQEATRGRAAATVTARVSGARPGPVHGYRQPLPVPADAGELRGAVTDLLACVDAWRAVDPGRRFTPALRAMASAREGTSDIALDTAARSLLSALTRYPLPCSPAVAATATRLRRAVNPLPRLTAT